jgi:Mpv17 / PMP22 family
MYSVYEYEITDIPWVSLRTAISGTGFGVAVKRMSMDQFLFSPAFTGLFFSVLMLAEGKLAQLPDKLEQDYWTTMKCNWALWMPAQLINFGLVPPHLQVLFANGVGALWSFYMSSVSFKKLEHPAVSDATATAAMVQHFKHTQEKLAPASQVEAAAAAAPSSEVRVITKRSASG